MMIVIFILRSAGSNNKDGTNNCSFDLNEEIIPEKPNVKWTDISGLVKAKEFLNEEVILPIRFPHYFEGAHMPKQGFLLYGPSGTGKTSLAKACAV